MINSVCFTGHRNIKNTAEIKKRLYILLEEVIQNGAVVFLAGGASGFDLLCEETIISLREKYPHIRLHIIMPCPEIEQTKNGKRKKI